MTAPDAPAGTRAPRVVVSVLAALAAVALLLCSGIVPTLFGGADPGEEGSVLACGAPPPVQGISGVSAEQAGNATVVVGVGRQLRVPPRGWVVALATALQESGLRNLDYGDRDSLGLFQQRPSKGWGTPAQIMDPRYSSAAFYSRLVRVPGWQRMRLTDAAQAVQVSGLPGAYQKWEPLAVALVARIVASGAGAGGAAGGAAAAAGLAAGVLGCVPAGVVGPSGWTAPAAAAVGSGFRTPSRPGHDGVDLIAARRSTIRAAAAGIVTTVVCNSGSGTCDVDGSPSTGGCGWYAEVQHGGGIMTRYCHMVQRPAVAVGQRVDAGQPIGLVGSSGNSSGPHLHFEVHVQGEPVDPVAFLLGRGVRLGPPA